MQSLAEELGVDAADAHGEDRAELAVVAERDDRLAARPLALEREHLDDQDAADVRADRLLERAARQAPVGLGRVAGLSLRASGRSGAAPRPASPRRRRRSPPGRPATFATPPTSVLWAISGETTLSITRSPPEVAESARVDGLARRDQDEARHAAAGRREEGVDLVLEQGEAPLGGGAVEDLVHAR